MTLAFYTAMLPGQKRPPKLKSLLLPDDDAAVSRPPRQPWEQQMAVVRQILKSKR